MYGHVYLCRDMYSHEDLCRVVYSHVDPCRVMYIHVQLCRVMYNHVLISFPDLLWTKSKARSGQIQFALRDHLSGM